MVVINNHQVTDLISQLYIKNSVNSEQYPLGDSQYYIVYYAIQMHCQNLICVAALIIQLIDCSIGFILDCSSTNYQEPSMV